MLVVASHAETKLGSNQEKVSYALGVKYGEALKQDFQDSISFDLLIEGIRDAAEAKPLRLTDKEIAQVLAEFQQRRISEKQQEVKKLSEKNIKEGEDFLSKNKTKDGVKTLESGLQYKVIKEGAGDKPQAKDKVRVHYHGTLIDGTVFDSSVERGESIAFPVTGVIRGWTEALQLMSVGAKWQLYIPPHLGYGERGTPGGPIGPNQTLLFEVELLGIE